MKEHVKQICSTAALLNSHFSDTACSNFAPVYHRINPLGIENTFPHSSCYFKELKCICTNQQLQICAEYIHILFQCTVYPHFLYYVSLRVEINQEKGHISALSGLFVQ